MSRPSGLPPIWSSNANYPAGSDSWSGTPTKVDPGTSKTAQGFVPGERVPAQWINSFWNKESAFIAYLDMIDALNWTPRIQIKSGVTMNLGANHLVWDTYRDMIWAVGGAGQVLFSYDGADWIDDSANMPGGTGDLTGIAWDTNNDCGIITSGTSVAGKLYYTGGSVLGLHAWSSVNVTGCSGIYGVRWDDVEEVFLFWGVDNSGNPALWSATAGAPPSYTLITLPSAGTVTGQARLVATGGSRTVVLARHSGTGTWYAWDGPGQTGPYVYRGAVTFLSAPVALTYNWTEALFMVTCASGHSYVSSDGISWVLQSVAAPFTAYALTSRGGLWIAGATLSSYGPETNVRRTLVSGNSGKNWSYLPQPVGYGKTFGAVAATGDRFLWVSSDGYFSQTLRTRP